MTYYKVVNQNLQSCMSKSRELGLDVQYGIGRWTYPDAKFAPLMVFSSFSDSVNFIKCNGRDSLKLFTCEIKKSKKNWGWVYNDDFCLVRTLIQHKKRASDYIFYSELPAGTIFADKVKLLEEIDVSHLL